MTLGVRTDGGLESVASVDRVASLTGVRAVAALLVVLTHAAYTTGRYNDGYVGLLLSRAEIGVPIFFVLSGYLLFKPWVDRAQAGEAAPSVRRYAWHRIRRIMPAYVVTVLAAYAVYHFREAGPNPGHNPIGLLRNLTLTQIYTDNYLFSYLHQGLTQMWSLAVEVAFYAALPVFAWLLLVVLCRRRWRPGLLIAGLAALAGISPAWLLLVHTTDGLPDGARLWLPTYIAWFVGGMLLAVLHRHGGLQMSDQDVFVNVVGGVKVSETSADLALLLAMVSSLRDRPLPQDLVVFGEVGLAGEIRPVPSGQERISEAAKHGFRRAIVPAANVPKKVPEGMQIFGVKKLADALSVFDDL